MHFEKNMIYHVYNQGNNHEVVFFEERNYLFFQEKMRTYLLPYADLLCFCLMPNHFHWLIRVKEEVLKIRRPGSFKSSDDSESSDDLNDPGLRIFNTSRTLNQSIAILLRSYTRAVNKQENRSGTLFRQHTKAKSGWIEEFITVDKYRHGVWDFRAFPDDEYGMHCFNYIHHNPCDARLVIQATDWEFSSAKDYAGLRNETLCNRAMAAEVLQLPFMAFRQDG